MTEQISAREFGAIEARVGALEDLVRMQSGKIDELLAIANRGRGGMWVLTLAAGALGASASTLLRKWF